MQRAQGHLVSGNYFSVLGVNALLGHVLTPEDDKPAAHPAAVMSYGYWKEKWNSDPQIVGRDLVINGTSFTLVGIAPVKAVTEDRTQPVFNLELVEGDSFFVGKDGALVHDNSVVRPVSEAFDARPALAASSAVKK